MYITALGRGILVLNSHKAATDLLDRRGHIYSDRPRFICDYISLSNHRWNSHFLLDAQWGWKSSPVAFYYLA